MRNARLLFLGTVALSTAQRAHGFGIGGDEHYVHNEGVLAGGEGFTVGGNAVFTQNGGVTSSFVYAGVGAYPGNATFNLNGGVASFAYLKVGGEGHGTVNQTGGSLEVGQGDGHVNISGWGGGSGTYNLAGGSLSATAIDVGPGGTIGQTGGTINLAGKLIVSAGGSYTATGGSLGYVAVDNGGSVTLDRKTASSSTRNVYSQSAGASLTFTDVLPTDAALYRLVGSIQPAGTLGVRLAPEYQPEEGDVLRLFSLGGRPHGMFDHYDLPLLRDGLAWEAEYGPLSINLRVVPEPTGLGAAVAGVAALATARRRCR